MTSFQVEENLHREIGPENINIINRFLLPTVLVSNQCYVGNGSITATHLVIFSDI